VGPWACASLTPPRCFACLLLLPPVCAGAFRHIHMAGRLQPGHSASPITTLPTAHIGACLRNSRGTSPLPAVAPPARMASRFHLSATLYFFGISGLFCRLSRLSYVTIWRRGWRDCCRRHYRCPHSSTDGLLHSKLLTPWRGTARHCTRRWKTPSSRRYYSPPAAKEQHGGKKKKKDDRPYSSANILGAFSAYCSNWYFTCPY